MKVSKAIEELSKKYSMSTTEFMKLGSINVLKERKRNLQIERLEMLSRYQMTTAKELEAAIKDSQVPEHPTWEDLIEIRNIEAEIREIDGDIKSIQAA